MIHRSLRWALLIALLSVACQLALRISPALFLPVNATIDGSNAQNRASFAYGWEIRRQPQRPDLMEVFDTGGTSILPLPSVPADQGYLLRIKIRSGTADQYLDLVVNQTPVGTAHPVRLERAQRFAYWIPPGVLRRGQNLLIIQHRGTTGQTALENVRVTNYRAVISRIHGLYIALTPPTTHACWAAALLGMLAVQCLGAWVIITLWWVTKSLASPTPETPSRWQGLQRGSMLGGAWGWLLLLSGATPYQLVFPGAFLWVAGFLFVGCCTALIMAHMLITHQWPAPGATRWREVLVARCRAHLADLRLKLAWLSDVLSPALGRARVMVPLVLIILYGALLRVNARFTYQHDEWNFLGSTNDVTLIMDAAARVLGTGTFTQFDGSYARVTGLAGYGLGLAAMAVGGVYPGFAWLKWWYLLIGSAIPLVGFAVVRAACGSAIGGLGVAALLASEPILIQESRTIYHDVPATLCAGLSLYWLARLLREERFRPRLAIFLGLSTGATILAKMSHACVVAVIVASTAVRRWTVTRWKHVGVALAVTLLVLGVWMGRNARLLGAPILSSQSGFVFACSTGHEVIRPVGVELSTVGMEQRLNAIYVQQAMHWILANPREYLGNALHKLHEFWYEGPSPWGRSLIWWGKISLGILLTWEQRLLVPMTPIALYLALYSVTFGFTWAALPTYYPPFLFLLIVAIAPVFVGTLGRMWQAIRWTADRVMIPRAFVNAVACIVSVSFILPFLQAPMAEYQRWVRQDQQERAYLAWVGSVIPERAVILKTDHGDPWAVHRFTHRPVVFNTLNGIPWMVYETPYGPPHFRRDWQYAPQSLTKFRLDIPRQPGVVDTALWLTPEEIGLVNGQGIRGLVTIWRSRGLEIFVLDTDATELAERFLPLNAYGLRGDQLTFKFYRTCPTSPHRALYRLLDRDDPRLEPQGPGAEQSVTWMTAPCPTREVTTVWFPGAFGDHTGMAKLFVNGSYAMSFQMGPLGRATWTDGGYQLQCEMQRLWTTARTGRKYSVGLFALTVPAEVVTPGQPLMLSVSPLLVTNDPRSWFGILEAPIEGPGLSGVDRVLSASNTLHHAVDARGRRRTIWMARSQAGR